MAAWTPSDLATTPRVWARAVNATFNGSNVLTALPNNGSEGGSFTVAGSPTKGAVSNAITSIRFDATTEAVTRTGSNWTTGAVFVFAVIKLLGTAASQGLVGASFTPTADSGFGFNVVHSTFPSYATGAGYNELFGDNDGPHYWLASNPISDTNLHLLQHQLGTTLSHRVDGVASTLTNTNAVTLGNLTSPTWDIGRGGPSPEETLNGDIFELLILDYIPTSADREKIEGWASWSVAGDGSLLPIGHTYKSAAPQTGGSPYTLTADAAAFTLSGQTANLEYGRLVAANAASFTLAGQAASLERGYRVGADAGSFSLSGQTAGLLRTHVMPATAGAFTLAGQDATLVHGTPNRTLSAAAGAFTLAGSDAALAYTPVTHYALAANAGAYALTGQAATLIWSGLPVLRAYPVSGASAAAGSVPTPGTLTAYPVSGTTVEAH